MKQSITVKKYAPLGITLLAYASLAGRWLIDQLRHSWHQITQCVAELTMGLAFFALVVLICSGLTLIL